nr:hypothetical protein CFP56_62404 [Quercus suber]
MLELGSSVSFKDRRWWQSVGGCHGVDEDHGVNENQRWWSLEASFPSRIGDGGSLWVSVTVLMRIGDGGSLRFGHERFGD